MKDKICKCGHNKKDHNFYEGNTTECLMGTLENDCLCKKYIPRKD